MVAGMTPTTANEDFVIACINAGYHVELAGGGCHTESIMRAKIAKIFSAIAPGQGLTMNLLFINQRLWSFQFPLLLRLREEGYNIEGLTIAAGVPSLEVSNEIIGAIKASGMRHISFKPGSEAAILQVCTIAAQNPDFAIILQWTGGRAGGHHSYEDFHQPILETYARIRARDNIVLVGGSGFGDGEGSWPYLTGEWSARLGYAAMPFDGILLGSRMMVAAEAGTSASVKQLICETNGMPAEEDWTRTYSRPTGGVVTVVSEMGEPIHKLATRCVLFWKELDETVFKLALAQRGEYLRQHRDRIIQRLNRDTHKVWFGRSEDGQPVDVGQMTYRQVLSRLAELLYLEQSQRWIDPTYQELFYEFLQRSLERRGPLQDPDGGLAVPEATPAQVMARLESVDLDILVSPEDVIYFLLTCRNPKRKPVPFVPVLDDNFETWFKKDSLWQSEFVEAVMDQDPQRTCILQGPVAVQYSRVANQPAKEILEEIATYYLERLEASTSTASTEATPWLGYREERFPRCTLSKSDLTPGQPMIQVTAAMTEMPVEDLARLLSDGQLSWLSCLILSSYIVEGRKIAKNRLFAFFRLSPGQTIRRSFAPDGNLQELCIESSELGRGNELVKVQCVDSLITLQVTFSAPTRPLKLVLKYQFQPQTPSLPIHEAVGENHSSIRQFYWDLWGLDGSEPGEQGLEAVAGLRATDAVFGERQIVSGEELGAFYQAVLQRMPSSGQSDLPLDYVMVLVWRAVIKCLFLDEVNGNLLRLVHMSNRVISKAKHAWSGTASRALTITSRARIASIKPSTAGKIVKVTAELFQDEVPVFQLESEFLFRGAPDKDDLYFERTLVDRATLKFASPKEWQTFCAKPWISWDSKFQRSMALESSSAVSISLDLVDLLEASEGQYGRLRETRCYGNVWIGSTEAGTVNFTRVGALEANPILPYIKEHSEDPERAVLLDAQVSEREEGGDPLRLSVPMDSNGYSRVSGDANPIHTDPRFAHFSALPGCIKHGMWTSAVVRGQIEAFYYAKHSPRMTEWKVSFDSFVLPNDQIQTWIWHYGMRAGRRLIRFESAKDDGTVVMRGTAEVAQSRTALLFTGQGSQAVGMGMDLYGTSAVAREIWDRADRHFRSKYGLSILQIVRENPKELTVHFRGRKGASVRDNYLALRADSMREGGVGDAQESGTLGRLFADMDPDSSCYTFSYPEGLLLATQFTQPALTLMERAAYEDLVSRALIDQSSPFAGHSLGEYAALAAVGNVLTVETLCDIVFYRGLTMQLAVSRDAKGRSSFGMVAVNPSRVGAHFSEVHLRGLVGMIGGVCGELLEIVNYNVKDWQYVVAGHLISLEILTLTLDRIARNDGIDQEALVRGIAKQVREKNQLDRKGGSSSGSPPPLVKGVATIPLAGIDVPFHSSFLKDGVSAFRKCLEARIPRDAVDPSVLCARYIPNLTGKPFALTLEYLETILGHCDSPIIRQLRDDWNSRPEPRALARKVLVELLAYQFASPVLWIATQDALLRDLDVQKVIEIGPSPVLAGMMERTLKMGYHERHLILRKQILVWHYQRNQAEIYHEALPTEAKSADDKPIVSAPPPRPSEPLAVAQESVVSLAAMR